VLSGLICDTTASVTADNRIVIHSGSAGLDLDFVLRFPCFTTFLARSEEAMDQQRTCCQMGRGDCETHFEGRNRQRVREEKYVRGVGCF
jgi:hypothetical protein